ncbi:MAG: 50S ribosomal protein L21 [Spirochaetes bacterium]|jgi:large subunit ribosomal protein L21|nr:50S ribosomal protein L21 [Spirochaetota bacterium]
MYAIVEIAGKQYKVEKDMVVNVDKLLKSEGDMTIEKILMFANGEDVRIGQPYLKDIKITAKLIGSIKGKKVRGIKFRRRKNYTRTKGHRQNYTQLKISEMTA